MIAQLDKRIDDKILRVSYKRPKMSDEQIAVLDDKHSIVVVEAATKVGKTTLCLVDMYETAIGLRACNASGYKVKKGDNIYWVAPVVSVSEIAQNRFVRMLDKSCVKYTINLTKHKIIIHTTGVVIWFKSAVKADNLYGDDVVRIYVDEGTRMKTDAWTVINSVRTATNARVTIIGNVKGNTNWMFKLGRSELDSVNLHTIKIGSAIKAGFVDQKMINEIKQLLDEPIYNELYECMPNVFGYRKFAYKWNESFLDTTKVIPNVPICLCLDFNYDPMCASVIQFGRDFCHVLRTYKIRNSDVLELSDRFLADYHFIPKSQIRVYGDPSGHNSDYTQAGHASAYDVIRERLGIKEAQVQIRGSYLTDESYRLLTAIVMSSPKIRFIVDKHNCQGLVEDFENVEVDAKQKVIKKGTLSSGLKADLFTHCLDGFKHLLQDEFYWLIEHYGIQHL